MDFHRAPGLVCGVADIFKQAVDALGFAGEAQLTAVPDELVGEQNPPLAGNNAHQVLLDFLRVGFFRELQAARYAGDMRVDHNSFGDLEPRAQPGRVSRSFIFIGTCPPKSPTIFRAAPTTDFDLFRKKPVERTSG